KCRFFISARGSFEYFARGPKGTTMKRVRKRVERIREKEPHGLRCRTSGRNCSMALLIEEILEHPLLPQPLTSTLERAGRSPRAVVRVPFVTPINYSDGSATIVFVLHRKLQTQPTNLT